MKKLAIIVAVAGLIATTAFAADMPVKMPVKAPPLLPAPVYIWTGWYVGGNGGYSWGRASTDWDYSSQFFFFGGSPLVCDSGGALCISGSDKVRMNGAIGGVQVGYNWQAGNYLAGIEADFQGSGQRGTTSFNIPFQVFGFVGAPADGFVTERMPWFGTVRGRVGYVADRLLLFATGGVAYGRVETNSLAQANGLPFLSCLSTLCPIWNISESTTKIGWTVGGGAEWALDGKWSAKIEYLFVDLGSFNAAFAGFPVCVGVAGGCFEEAAGRGSINSRITDNIVRVGLNYRFSPAPVVAKY